MSTKNKNNQRSLSKHTKFVAAGLGTGLMMIGGLAFAGVVQVQIPASYSNYYYPNGYVKPAKKKTVAARRRAHHHHYQNQNGFNHFYVTVGGGMGFTKHNNMTGATFTSTGKYTGILSPNNNRKLTGVLHGALGYMFDQSFGIEAGGTYQLPHHSKFSDTMNLVMGQKAKVKGNETTSAWNTYLAGVGVLHLTHKLSVVGKLGVGYGQISQSGTISYQYPAMKNYQSGKFTNNHKGFGIYGAAGVNYAISNSFGAGVEVDHLTGQASQTDVLGTLSYKF